MERVDGRATQHAEWHDTISRPAMVMPMATYMGHVLTFGAPMPQCGLTTKPAPGTQVCFRCTKQAPIIMRF